jgi:hypothetical protein
MRRAITAALAALAMSACEPTCTEDCSGDCMVQRFLEDPDLCGNEPTAVDCQTVCAGSLEDHIFLGERLIEVASYATDGPFGPAGAPRGGDSHGMGLYGSRVWFSDRHRQEGLPHPAPLASIRAGTEQVEPGETRMSLYSYTMDMIEGCDLLYAIAWSWTLRERDDDLFADDFEASIKVERRWGSCGSTVPRPGEAWKIEGKLYRPGACRRGGGGAGGPCDLDGWVNPWCEWDPDEPCFHDGVCEEFCPGDPDCDCALDGRCNPDCIGTDPDCACGPDARCNPLCPDDPDCACAWDYVCNPLCPEDPDCLCVPDGECVALCGWLDPDCWCVADGVCNPDCEMDPDCPCVPDGECDPGCESDPDCACIEDGDCNPECDYDPDC